MRPCIVSVIGSIRLCVMSVWTVAGVIVTRGGVGCIMTGTAVTGIDGLSGASASALNWARFRVSAAELTVSAKFVSLLVGIDIAVGKPMSVALSLEIDKSYDSVVVWAECSACGKA